MFDPFFCECMDENIWYVPLNHHHLILPHSRWPWDGGRDVTWRRPVLFVHIVSRPHSPRPCLFTEDTGRAMKNILFLFILFFYLFFAVFVVEIVKKIILKNCPSGWLFRIDRKGQGWFIKDRQLRNTTNGGKQNFFWGPWWKMLKSNRKNRFYRYYPKLKFLPEISPLYTPSSWFWSNIFLPVFVSFLEEGDTVSKGMSISISFCFVFSYPFADVAPPPYTRLGLNHDRPNRLTNSYPVESLETGGTNQYSSTASNLGNNS